jgi:anti-sigma-K factor RskA
MPAAAAAAIVIAVIGGLLATRDNEQSEAALLAELQSQGAPTFAMSDTGEARLVVAADGRRAVIVASGIAPLDDDHTYQAWTIDSNTDISPAPLFRPDASGNVVVALRSLPDDLDTVAVTIEPRSGSKLPTTPVLMSAKVTA